MTKVSFHNAGLSQAEDLASLRARAMRPSLEAVGRYDPDRARARVLSEFDPTATWTIRVDDTDVGFFVLRDKVDHLYLDHLYVDTPFQGQGIGRAVVSHVQELGLYQAKPVRLIALIKSPANAFYLACGFREIAQDGVDVTYEWRAERTGTEPK